MKNFKFIVVVILILFVVYPAFWGRLAAKIVGWTEATMTLLFDALDPNQDGVLTDNDWWVYSNALVKNKLDATVAPDADNDTDEDYAPGSVWIDVTNDNSYICLDATDGAAVWQATNASAVADDAITMDKIDDDGDFTDLTGDWATTGILRGRAEIIPISANTDLTEATHGGAILLVTAIANIGLWDCTASNLGSFVPLKVKDAAEQVIVYAQSSGDLFKLTNGDTTDAGDEVDLTTGGNEKFTFVCAETNTWHVWSEDDTVTDGGAHSY